MIPVPCSAISHFYCKRISVSNNFAVLYRADKLDNVIFGMRQELKGELLWQKVVSPRYPNDFPNYRNIPHFFYSGACPEQTKNWVPRPVIQLQKSSTQIPCCRTHIQNKGNAVTDRKHNKGFSKPVQATHEHSWSLQYECQKKIGKLRERMRIQTIFVTKCLQTDAGSNFLIGEEGEIIQCNDIFVI